MRIEFFSATLAEEIIEKLEAGMKSIKQVVQSLNGQ
jgi:hypothetical protein